jgi:hypothetical protein
MGGLRTIAVAAVWALAAGGAWAAEPPTPEASAEARALIARAGAEDLFSDATDGTVPGVRHLRSGMVCTFEPGDPQNGITIFPNGVRGDDVSCSTDLKEIHVTLYATRYPADQTIDALMTGAVASIRQVWRDVEPYSGRTVTMTAKAPGFDRVTQRFQAVRDGRKVFTKVTLAKAGDWTIMLRVTAPIELAVTADLYGEVKMIATLDGLRPKT